MKSSKHSTVAMVPDPSPVRPVRVALKIQRRCYGTDALSEVGIHHLLRRGMEPCRDLVNFREAFFHDGHICAAYGLHGRSLDHYLEKAPLPLGEVRVIARQLLRALVRMHHCGYAHTDIKPMNILHRRTPRPRALLSDLGSADNQLRQGSNRGTREYTSPEIILGTPLDPKMDIWALACTLFEIATGRDLFLPYRAAGKKYAEFNRELPPTAFDPAVALDDAEEEAEQYTPGAILSGKYRLESRLGMGKFATVWRSVVLHAEPLDGSYDTLLANTQAIHTAEQEPSGTAKVDRTAARDWQRARGARDLHDLVLNYEHLVLMQDLLGPPPAAWVVSGKYAGAYCDPAGKLKHDPVPQLPVNLETLLRRRKMRAQDARALAAFLTPLLAWEPSQRPDALACLEHPWLAEA